MSEKVHDPRVLRAIAHPTRNRILAELTATGSMRAADIARELDVPANQASFHLRQLAKYGLVEEDAEAARDRRDRVWKVASETGLTINLHDLEEQPGGRAAAAVFRRSGAAWHHHVIERAYAADRPGDVHRSLSENALRLTSEEAGQLATEIGDLIEQWTRRARADKANDDRRTYLVLHVLQPFPDAREVS